MKEKNYQKNIYYVLLFIAVIMAGSISKILASVILPVIFAVILSFIFLPVVTILNTKLKIPPFLTTIIISIIVIVVILIISSLLGTSLNSILSKYPEYEAKFLTIYKFLANTFNFEFDEKQSLMANMLTHIQFREYLQKFLIIFTSSSISVGRNIMFVLLLFMFLNLELRNTTKKLVYAFPNNKQGTVTKIVKRIIKEVTHFLSIKFLVSLATGIFVYLGSLLFSLDFPIIWGFLAFIMNFIPTFGSIISTLSTTIFAILEFYPAAPYKAALVLFFLLVVNFTIGNILEPRIEGKNLGISPFVILVSLTLWGYIWGFMGMILAVPMMVIIKIICENVSFLHGFAILIGNDAKKTDLEVQDSDSNEN